jgi:F420H(2)-dependent quinone reductase
MNLFQITGAIHVALFRASKGRVGGRLRGAPVLLLTTKGRKTGKERTTPLLYLEDGGRLVVIASKGGAPSHPAWFLNLQADPTVTVERGKGKERYRARVAEGEERDALWQRVVAMYGSYADYQKKTSRQIPVVVLEPAT